MLLLCRAVRQEAGVSDHQAPRTLVDAQQDKPHYQLRDCNQQDTVATT